MKFWDASALASLIIEDSFSPRAGELSLQDAARVVWWGSEVECVSAIARMERLNALGAEAVLVALERLERLVSAWREVPPSPTLRKAALRLLRLHPLRAADALQLAAAMMAGEGAAGPLPFVTFDARLADAARREGFSVLGPK